MGRVDTSAIDLKGRRPQGPVGAGGQVEASGPKGAERFKLKCPSCEGSLAFEEGCAKCYGCGYSQC